MSVGTFTGRAGHMSGKSEEIVTRKAGQKPDRQLQRALEQIEEALHSLRFGQVTITVQDGVVVQIDRLERTRLPRPGESNHLPPPQA